MTVFIEGGDISDVKRQLGMRSSLESWITIKFWQDFNRDGQFPPRMFKVIISKGDTRQEIIAKSIKELEEVLRGPLVEIAVAIKMADREAHQQHLKEKREVLKQIDAEIKEKRATRTRVAKA